jgi:hypothetical protein
MSFILTRIHVDDYEAWKQMFDADPPGARQDASRHRILRGAEDPNELVIEVEFPSAEEARAARQRLVDSGVLERVTLRGGPDLIEEAETVAY